MQSTKRSLSNPGNTRASTRPGAVHRARSAAAGSADGASSCTLPQRPGPVPTDRPPPQHIDPCLSAGFELGEVEFIRHRATPEFDPGGRTLLVTWIGSNVIYVARLYWR
jgi:hypothetical protein